MRINLDSTNGHIVISLMLVAAGVALMAVPQVGIDATITGGLFGAGLARLERSLSKPGDQT